MSLFNDKECPRYSWVSSWPISRLVPPFTLTSYVEGLRASINIQLITYKFTNQPGGRSSVRIPLLLSSCGPASPVLASHPSSHTLRGVSGSDLEEGKLYNAAHIAQGPLS